jgi:hypothetical protein
VWQKHPKWLEVKKIFSLLRDEYRKLIEADTSISAVLKEELIADLMSVRLAIPGSNPARSKKDCGIDLRNAFYYPDDHELTVCAGDFNAHSPLLTIAHEMGHAFSLGRRVENHLRKSDYGKSLLDLWGRSCGGKHFACAEWERYKTEFQRHASTIPNYHYEDATRLDTFITKQLLPVPEGEELLKLADRLSKTTLRTEIDSYYLENLIKAEEMRTVGRILPSYFTALIISSSFFSWRSMPVK